MRNFVTAVLLVLAARPVHAVEIASPGTISALIRDEGGNPIPGVTVTLVPTNRSAQAQVAITPADGIINFKNVESGDYSLKCQLSGFFDLTLGPIPVRYSHNGPDVPKLLKITMVPGPIWY